jgi:hypothetical protein
VYLLAEITPLRGERVNNSMPKKSTPPLSEEERSERIRETAREVEASDNAKDFERAFKKIVPRSKPKEESR